MKRFLLASVATVGLTFAALPAMAQVAVPVPATPPITAPEVLPQPEAEATDVTAATPITPEVQVTPPAPEIAAQSAPTPPDATVSAQAEPAAPAIEPQAAENAVLATPASAASVCEARTTSVHFGARGSALSQQNRNAIQYAASVCEARTTSVHFGARGSVLSQLNRNAIQYAADAASVCDLQTVTITDSAEGRTSARRAEAVRATLVSQGIPAERITIAQEANADADAASTGRLDVRMAFAGVADGGSPATAAAAPASAPEAPAITPETPGVATTPSPVTPPEGGPEGEEDTDPTPST